MTSAHVICIDATPPTSHNRAPRLETGRSYTVLERVRRRQNGREEDGLIIAEARFPRALDGVEDGWLGRRFIPAGETLGAEA